MKIRKFSWGVKFYHNDGAIFHQKNNGEGRIESYSYCHCWNDTKEKAQARYDDLQLPEV